MITNLQLDTCLRPAPTLGGPVVPEEKGSTATSFSRSTSAWAGRAPLLAARKSAHLRNPCPWSSAPAHAWSPTTTVRSSAPRMLSVAASLAAAEA